MVKVIISCIAKCDRVCRRQEDIGLRFLHIARSMQTNELLGMMDDPVVGAFRVSCVHSSFVLDYRRASNFKDPSGGHQGCARAPYLGLVR